MARFLRGRTTVMTLVALAVGLGPMPTANAEPPPTEIVIPPTMRTTPSSAGGVHSAGSTGFLHADTDSSRTFLEWTTYGGETRPVEGTEGMGVPAPVEYRGADSDVVALRAPGSSDVLLRDMATGASWHITIPAGQEYYMTLGDTVVTKVPATQSSYVSEIHLLRADQGATVDRKVTGLPEGANFLTGKRGSAQGLLVYVSVPGQNLINGWVDLATAHLELLPIRFADAVVADGYLLTREVAGIGMNAIGHLSAPERVVARPQKGARIIGFAGDALIVGRYDPAYGEKMQDESQWRISAVPFDGTAEYELVARANVDTVAIRPGGGLILNGGSSALDYGLVSITADSAGKPRVDLLHPIAPVQMVVHDLLIDQGQVTTVERGDGRTAVYTRDLVADSPGYGPRVDRGSFQKPLENCDWPGRSIYCPPLVATGDGRVVYDSTQADGSDAVAVVNRGAGYPAAAEVKTGLVPTQDGRAGIDGASGNLVLVTGQSAAGAMETRVIDIDTGTVIDKRPVSVSALWGSSLWTLARTFPAGNLEVTGKDLSTGANVATSTIKEGCSDLSDLQVRGEWIYWSCYILDVGTASGVLNMRTGTNTRLPVTGPAQLGDGGVVVDTFQSKRYDVHTGSVLVTPLGGGRSALDPRSGDIAVHTNSGTRVLHEGLPAAPLTSPYRSVSATADTDSTPVAWRGTWWLTEPAASWTLTLRNKVTGQTVATRSGGAVAYSVSATWDGRSAGGGYLPNGPYTWTLTAKPADGQGADLRTTGTMNVVGGTAVPRDFVKRDGVGDLLAFTSAGVADFRAGTGTGSVDAKVSGSGWTGANTVTAAVPFGDVNGDRCNDVLVRVKSGELRAYKPSCGAALKPTTAFTRVGLGWNIYDALTSPGDLTGDGRADVLARETSTGYLYLYEQTSAGAFKARVRIGTGWKGYLLTGAGDLNGDGKGDLLARDAAGVLWRYAGTGKGTLAARVKVGGGWQVYNSLVGVGDVSGDGKADLLARDTAGVLWSYRGDGKGLFGYRAKVGGGWQMYKSLV
ncbi:FG-GAP-like repeat-containing protein [Streptomyces sp. NPDC005761]|uniref:FG-GAP-like repeat-containing protein n=1 Tax=Streptomyces sp. NPDC005761 TaxID=3157066 RepID=UPI0033D7BF38